MAPTKNKKKSPVDENYNISWKESGAEQKELNRLFEYNLIESFETPNSVRLRSPLFLKFSPRVFGVHFRKTKAKFGLFAKLNDPLEGTSKSDIPELGLEVVKASIYVPTNFDDIPNDSISNIECINPPVATWTYLDHQKKCSFVYVAVATFGGSTGIDFNLSEDGLKVSINYTWPSAIFNPIELFEDDISNTDPAKKIAIDHPKIHQLATQLLKAGITEKSSPRGKFIVTLPIEVQREVGTWKKMGVKKIDGTKIVLLKFKGFQQDKIIEDADKTVSFD